MVIKLVYNTPRNNELYQFHTFKLRDEEINVRGPSKWKTQLVQLQKEIPRNRLQVEHVKTSFRYYDNSDVIVTWLIIGNIYLYLIQLWWSFFKIFINGDLVFTQTYEVLPLKNPTQPPEHRSNAVPITPRVWIPHTFHIRADTKPPVPNP